MLSSALSLCCGYIPSGQCRALMGPFLFWVELDWSQQQQAAVFSQVPLVPVPPGFCHPWCRDTFALHASMLWSNILHHILRVLSECRATDCLVYSQKIIHASNLNK